MIQIRLKALGMLIAVFALGAAIAVPGIAIAEGGPPEALPVEEAAPESSPSLEVTPLAEESCQSGYVCVWPQTGYQGARGRTLCSAIGRHHLAGTKKSAKNRCSNRASGLDRSLEAVDCLNPNGSAPNLGGGFNEVIMAESTSFRCS